MFFRASKGKARNEVHGFADGSGDDEYISTASKDIGKLDVELLVIFIEETSGDGGVDVVQRNL